MGYYKRMNVIAIPVAIALFAFMFPRCLEVLNEDLARGVGFIGGAGIGAYLFGCLIGLSVNFILQVRNKLIRIVLLIPIGVFLLVLVWKVSLKLYYLYS